MNSKTSKTEGQVIQSSSRFLHCSKNVRPVPLFNTNEPDRLFLTSQKLVKILQCSRGL